jgi:DNA-binding GntR family transcriptional regulator
MLNNQLLATKPLYEEVADMIREKIFDHELPPGSWIDEKYLTQLFGISRTPLREAIKVLASEGLITMKIRRGAYVTEVDTKEIAQIFEVIALLEGKGAKTVAINASEKELENLDSIHLKLEKAAADRDIDRFFELNQEFHDKIQEIAGNRWMRKVISDLRQVLKLQRRNSLTKIGRLEQSLQEHRQILSAIIARKGDLSEELMINHLQQGKVAAV